LTTASLTEGEIQDLTTALTRLEYLTSVMDTTGTIDFEDVKQERSTFSVLVNLIERAIIVHDAEEIEV
jgi:hypothetical protein